MGEQVNIGLMMRYGLHRDGRLNRVVRLNAIPLKQLSTTIPLYDRNDVSGLPARWSIVDRDLSDRAKTRFAQLFPLFWTAAGRAAHDLGQHDADTILVLFKGRWNWGDARSEQLGELSLRVYEFWPSGTPKDGRVLLYIRGQDRFKPDLGPWKVGHGDSEPPVRAESREDDQEWADLRERLAARTASQLIEMMKAFRYDRGRLR